MPDSYDVIVIGAGPAGYVCAIRAAQLGQHVAIIDREFLGGVCLNIGCIPSKALLHNAEVIHTIRERGKEFGFSFDGLHVDYAAAVKRSREVAARLVKGVEFLMKKNKIDVLMGTARLTAGSTVELKGADGKVQNLTAKNVVIATGARPARIPGVTPDGKKVVTYREAIVQESLPASVLIVGGSAIGVEFATVWSAYGSKVTLVELLPRIVPLEDDDVSAELTRQFTQRGMTVMTGSKIESVDASGKRPKVTIRVADGSQQVVDVDQVLVSAGVQPNSDGLGLEAVGVKLDRGAVAIDDSMRTNVPGVWAVGDVTGKLMLAHVGSAMGVVCAEHIAGHKTITLDYLMMPKATYSHPQVASFGYTERQARERGLEVKVGKFNFQANGKALGVGEGGGWIKVVSDAKYGEILGVHMIGPDVTELLPELTLAQQMELTTEEIARNVHAHPTLSEVLMEVAHGLTSGYIHQ